MSIIVLKKKRDGPSRRDRWEQVINAVADRDATRSAEGAGMGEYILVNTTFPERTRRVFVEVTIREENEAAEPPAEEVA